MAKNYISSNNPKRRGKAIGITLAIIVIGVVIVGGWYWLMYNNLKTSPVTRVDRINLIWRIGKQGTGEYVFATVDTRNYNMFIMEFPPYAFWGSGKVSIANTDLIHSTDNIMKMLNLNSKTKSMSFYLSSDKEQFNNIITHFGKKKDHYAYELKFLLEKDYPFYKLIQFKRFFDYLESNSVTNIAASDMYNLMKYTSHSSKSVVILNGLTKHPVDITVEGKTEARLYLDEKDISVLRSLVRP